MQRIAVFVDAGYLFAQGSSALTGGKKARADLTLDAPAAISELKQIAATCAPSCSLLRIYWYDGTLGSRPTADHAVLAQLNDVKVRLGAVNSQGQQKGVDSLIVTDLIELARQKSIYDALVLAGDEDIRVGVQIAQTYGVRVHLLGISPSRGSQSRELLQEVDTTHEWQSDVVRRFLSERTTPTLKNASEMLHQPTVEANATASLGGTVADQIENVVCSFIDALESTDIEKLMAYWQTERGLPSEYDSPLLRKARQALGRDLETEEKRLLRKKIQAKIQIYSKT
ncbi:NYN domain-containing protein [Xanthobacter sp. DSM 24535]|uniref:NYN domain-containing protein n=1 Tax=Roseixanthobacter psychrophilus TaxID=3119917 RepID=UPI003727780D